MNGAHTANGRRGGEIYKMLVGNPQGLCKVL
jgi:hypothetical protein